MKVGVFGGGQLARMLALAGQPMGQRFRFLERASPDGRALSGDTWALEPGDGEGLERFAEGLSVLTFENESWDPHVLERAARKAPVHPSPRALALSQDRLLQKQMFARLGLDSAPFVRVDAPADLAAAAGRLGLPAILKTRRGGYDGRGQWLLRAAEDVASAQRELGARTAILEALVPFERELSVLAVRAPDGTRAFYPLVENHHERGCLRLSLAPAARVGDGFQATAEAMAGKLLDELEYVGVLALELFEREGRLLANELAPRVHNSGHWTIEGAETSQFENHLRAIAGLPLGSTRALGTCAMLNLLGSLPPAERVLAVPGAHLHVYGKQPAPGRKLGHVTLRARDEAELTVRLRQLATGLCVTLPAPVEAWMHSSS